ncbi:MAG: hypothetical protein A3H91_04770 [Gammaproteobacteria bacterium RIFCSPLOWO2_02_FULL_61_13]|nr:MAG: hypothetical protein A3H91_04770 [Gammaproteobacteria bacterium RIFCSPLOWO2_02_FULL_61_13]
MLNWTAANTLFLQYYDAAQLPIISIASAVLIPLSGLVYIKLNRWLPFSRQFLIFASLFVVMPVVFRFLLAGDGVRWPSLAFAVWYYLDVAFAALLIDSFVNRMFNLRQAKRVFGPISTGSDMAGVPAGLLVGVMVGYSGVENLLLVAAGVSAIVLGLFYYATHAYKARVESGDVQGTDGDGDGGAAVSIKALLRNPLVLCILGIEAFSEFNLEFVNNAFYSQTEQYLSNPEAMAAFLGTFFAIASVVSSVVQMLASSRLMRIFGIGGCLVLGPSLLVLMLLAFVASTWIGLAPAFVFSCMAGAKFVQYTIMINVNDVAQFTLVRSLPPIVQDRVLALSGTVLSPVLGGLSGLSLLGLIHWFGAQAADIAAVTTGILVIIIIIARRAAQAYSTNLKQMLSERAISGVELPLNDAGTAQMLVNMLSDPDPLTAMCGLDLLDRQPREEFKPALAAALRHAEAGVRARAATAFQQQAGPADLDALQQALQQESDPVVVAALLPSLARAAGSDCVILMQGYLAQADARVAQGALVGLARHGGAEGLDNAGRNLEQLMSSADTAKRAFVAETLGKIGASSLDGLIVPLLKDEDLEVRRKAIEAARFLRNPLLGAPVVENLGQPELRPTVVETLIEGSEVLLPPVDELYEQSRNKLELRAMILHIYGRVKTAEGIRLLEKRLMETEQELQQEAIMALARSNYRPGDAGRRMIDGLINRYSACATWLLRCLMEIEPLADQTLLQRALLRELHKKQDVLFTLLGFLHPADVMRHIRFACLYSKSEDKVAAAIELLESMLQRGCHAPLLPIFEGASLDRRVTALEKTYPGRAAGVVQRLREVLAGECGSGNRWVAAATLDFLRTRAELAQQIEIPGNEQMSTARAWMHPPAEGAGGRMSVIQRVTALKRTAIFADVPEEVLSEFAPEAIERSFSAGADIIREGEIGSTLSVVVAGKVRIHSWQLTLAELGEGGVFGELSALSPEPRSANVNAVEETRILELSAAAVERMIATRGEAAEGIIRVLCQRIQTSITEKTYHETGSFRVQPPATPSARPTRMLLELEKVVWLKKVEIFHTLSDTILLHLARLATEQWLDKGDTLFEKGDMGTAMYVIVEGEIAVHDDGKLIATLRPGEILGELALLTSEVRSSSISAKTPARLLKITQSVVQELMWDHYHMTRGMIRILVTRLRTMMTIQKMDDSSDSLPDAGEPGQQGKTT